MNAAELAALMLMMGENGKPISQAKLGALIKFGPDDPGRTERQVRRWLKGDSEIPAHVAAKVREIANQFAKRRK